MQNPNAVDTDEQLIRVDSMKQEIQRSLSQLTDRQQEVIRLFFGIGEDHPLSLEEIGDRFGITRERVRQIKDKAITKLRSTSRSQYLKSYMG
jgi:RNA polymerase primary sigma factor